MTKPEYTYLCHRTSQAITIDGNLNKPVWLGAAKSPRFVDMATGQPALLNTQSAALWDEQNLYVAFWIEEPYPTAKLTERDSIIFSENDVEIFIDGGDCYYEFEINALNTVYEILFVWRDAYTRGSRFDVPEFDLLARKAVSFGGNFDREERSFWWGTHPRGLRWAFLDWDLPGLQTAVQIQGALNDPTTVSTGWTVEMALPWQGMRWLANGRALPPHVGDEWRIFFGRFQKIPFGEREMQAAWCLSPHGTYDTHMPEKFTPVRFVS
jgi:hypothetical protein